MESSLIIFVFGTVVSYFPVYWLLSGLTRRAGRHRAAPVEKVGGADVRSAFLQSLRREAVVRISTALRETLATGARAMQTRGSSVLLIDDATAGRLEEIRRMSLALFTIEATSGFDKLVQRIDGAEARDIADLERGITALVAALSSEWTRPPAVRSRRSFWKTLEHKLRGAVSPATSALPVRAAVAGL